MAENCPLKGSCAIIRKGQIPTSELGLVTKRVADQILVYGAVAALCVATNPKCSFRRASLENAPADSRCGPLFADMIEEAFGF